MFSTIGSLHTSVSSSCRISFSTRSTLKGKQGASITFKSSGTMHDKHIDLRLTTIDLELMAAMPLMERIIHLNEINNLGIGATVLDSEALSSAVYVSPSRPVNPPLMFPVRKFSPEPLDLRSQPRPGSLLGDDDCEN